MSKVEIKKVYYDSENQTIIYAAQELSKYLGMMGNCEMELCNSGKVMNADDGEGIHIGLFNQLGVQSLGIEDAFLDDELYIDISNGQGIIAGIDPRSVLLAVYRMLTEAGCAWVRPGEDGENIPKKSLEEINIHIHEKPSYRHRGIDFGGPKNREDVLNLIRWAPKLGFNTIFFEGINPWKERFYTSINHKDGSRTKHYSYDMSKKYYEEAILEIKKLGLLYHTAGHGFTSSPFDLKSDYKGEIDEDTKQYLAMIDGKRGIRGNFTDTNLCYSNPKTRDLITDYIVELLKESPEVDLLHVWLADGINNHCECDGCIDVLPSDQYIKLLNELDEKLTKSGIGTRIVFLSYIDLIWKPETEELHNKDRFILTHAPFYRTYDKSFKDVTTLPDLPEFMRNENKYPVSVSENAAFVKSWQDYFNDDNFFFEYHYWRGHYSDPGQFKIAKVLYDDITSFKKLGVNGYVSCQVVKCFLPNGLGMHVMGRTLWNSSISFDTIVQEYFDAAFGEDGQKCMEFFKKLTELYGLDPDDPDADFQEFSWTNSGYEKNAMQKKSAEDFNKIISHVEDFVEIIEMNLQDNDSVYYASWKYLSIFANMVNLLVLTWESKVLYNEKRTKAAWRLLESYILEHEDDIGEVFDVGSYLSWIQPYFK